MPPPSFETARGSDSAWGPGAPTSEEEDEGGVTSGSSSPLNNLEGWYKLRWRHSALGYPSPANDEQRYRTAA